MYSQLPGCGHMGLASALRCDRMHAAATEPLCGCPGLRPVPASSLPRPFGTRHMPGRCGASARGAVQGLQLAAGLGLWRSLARGGGGEGGGSVTSWLLGAGCSPCHHTVHTCIAFANQ